MHAAEAPYCRAVLLLLLLENEYVHEMPERKNITWVRMAGKFLIEICGKFSEVCLQK